MSGTIIEDNMYPGYITVEFEEPENNTDLNRLLRQACTPIIGKKWDRHYTQLMYLLSLTNEYTLEKPRQRELQHIDCNYHCISNSLYFEELLKLIGFIRGEFQFTLKQLIVDWEDIADSQDLPWDIDISCIIIKNTDDKELVMRLNSLTDSVVEYEIIQTVEDSSYSFECIFFRSSVYLKLSNWLEQQNKSLLWFVYDK